VAGHVISSAARSVAERIVAWGLVPTAGRDDDAAKCASLRDV
jgi:hypothetical protein